METRARGDGDTLLLSAGQVVGILFSLSSRASRCNYFVHELFVYRIAVQFHGQDNIFIDIQDRNKVVVLEDKADVAPAEDSKPLVVQFGQLFPLI